MTFDSAYWKEHYDNDHTPWDIGAVSTPLKEYIDQLTDKQLRILIPGSGRGHEAIYLAENGFTNVTVIDLVDEAFGLLRQKAPSVQCIAGDFFAHEGTYDRILEQTLFCAIDPSMRDAYMAQVAALLAPGGKYAGVLFDREFEGGPPFGGSKGEYAGYLEKYFSAFRLEDCYNSIMPRMGSEVFVIAVK